MVAVVGPEGPILTEAGGWADPLAGTPLTPASRTPVASVSKVVTSLTALRLHRQVTVTRDDQDVLLGQRRLTPSHVPGRWCDAEGCLAAVASADGTVTLVRSDRAMLEQTLAPAPWRADQRFVPAAVSGAVLATLLALGGSVRAWWRRRRGSEPVPAISRPLALAWGLVSLTVVAATVALPLSVLTGQSLGWIRGEGPAIWALPSL